MMETKICLKLCLAAVLLMASMASGGASIWQRATVDGAGNWNDSANWNPYVPAGTPILDEFGDPVLDEFGDPTFTADDEGGVPTANIAVTRTGVDAANLAEMQVTDSQTFGGQLRHGYNDVASTDGPLLRIMDGGTLTGNSGSARAYIGHSSAATMTVDDGGVFTPLHRLYVGFGGEGTLNVAGIVNVTTGNPSRFYVGGDDPGVTDAEGFVNVLDGGVLNLKNNKLYFQQGHIDIAGSGIITFAGGSMVDEIDDLIAADQISGDGIDGNVLATYDGTNTTVTVIPEPATMILLGLGGLLIRKRR